MSDPELASCNHHHQLTAEHEWVEIGGERFVANKRAVPLLVALNAAGLRTRSHHLADAGPAFVVIALGPDADVSVRHCYTDGQLELCLAWRAP